MSPSQSHPGEEPCAGQGQARTARAPAGGELGFTQRRGSNGAIVGSDNQSGFPQLVVFEEM